jgi:hypothetical protein
LISEGKIVRARSSVALAFGALVLAYGSGSPSAQMAPQSRPQGTPSEQPQPTPRPPALPPPPGANICTTQYGWCQLPTITAPLGFGCACLTADNREVPGTTRYFPYYGPASPYLQPHTTAPETIR